MVPYSVFRESELSVGSVGFGGEDGSVRVYENRLLVVPSRESRIPELFAVVESRRISVRERFRSGDSKDVGAF